MDKMNLYQENYTFKPKISENTNVILENRKRSLNNIDNADKYNIDNNIREILNIKEDANPKADNLLSKLAIYNQQNVKEINELSEEELNSNNYENRKSNEIKSKLIIERGQIHDLEMEDLTDEQMLVMAKNYLKKDDDLDNFKMLKKDNLDCISPILVNSNTSSQAELKSSQRNLGSKGDSQVDINKSSQKNLGSKNSSTNEIKSGSEKKFEVLSKKSNTSNTKSRGGILMENFDYYEGL